MRVLLVCRYDGSKYHGFQIQPNNKTIQEMIEKSLCRIHKGENVRIHMSGRTDSGVHAYLQPIHFDTNLNLTEDAWVKSVNAYLPKDIRIIGSKIVGDDFHVRFNSMAKTYEYRLCISKNVDPFLVNYVGHTPFKFDYKKAEECLQYFIGTYDFSSFCSKNSSVEDKVRTITNFNIKQENNIVIFEITGDGFLYNMVRIIIGTITDVAIGKYDKSLIPEIINKKDRSFAGKRAEASGLYLKNVIYNEKEINKFIENLHKN
ncbi:tRNA pseudouridine(38-40) synthase TruA [Gemella sp. GH3]|uniref:tRNA pseudouridine(38-40) synthase TruA n=1 Tax=unclassified Gemella TaxID=2624949 RepID=UPI0015D0C819|nr:MULTISPECIES: tRNA pseudouridine(38-40) synthase TruA [unclassified Gemella]MBF0714410.1 tRNA pseudouridine(38-40) synthase TruA [Gemella sp. GH3.1]NYS51362.1 tRNA pseudouridine(38-40) synthase TruA [Gemella sp. GH3]